jgi:tetratricopeptide (TPR) repeat protein
VVALRLLGIRQAQGQEQTAARLVDDVEKGAKQVFAGAPSAEAMDEVREAVRRAEAVALAAGDRKTARRLVEIGLGLAGRPDRRATLAAIDTLAVLLSSGRSSAAAALRTRLLDAELLNARRDDPLSARFILHRGIAAEQAGDLAAAEQDYRQALSLDEATHGREHPLVAVDLLRIAGARELAGDRPAATEARSQAVAIAEQAARTASPDALPDLRTLAAALAAAGETDAATKLLKGMVDAQLRSDGAKSLEVARLLGDSADVFKRRGNAGRASELLGEAIAIADAVVGAGHQETLALAAKLEQLKRFGITEQFATRTSVPLAAADAVRAAEVSPQAATATEPPLAVAGAPVAAAAPRDSEIDAALAAIAADTAAGRLPAALRKYKELGQQVWKKYGADDLRVAQVAVPYVRLLVECGDLEKARSLADRAAATRVQRLGPGHPATAEALLAAVAVHVAAGEIGEAWAGYCRARSILLAAASGPERARGERALIEAACHLGDLPTAISEAERFLVGRSIEAGGDDTTAVRAYLCEALLAGGAAERAVVTARGLVPQAAVDQSADAGSVPTITLLARAEQAAGLSDWNRTAAAAEAALVPALDSTSAGQCRPDLIRAGRELAVLRARGGDGAGAGALDLAERAAAAARALPERHRERLAAERALAELVVTSGAAAAAAPPLETARGQAIDAGVREAVLRHFATAVTLPL